MKSSHRFPLRRQIMWGMRFFTLLTSLAVGAALFTLSNQYVRANSLQAAEFMPSGTELDTYECRHRLGYSRFHSSRNQLEAELLAFVPVDAACEINCLKLKNTSDMEKIFRCFRTWNFVSGMLWMMRRISRGI